MKYRNKLYRVEVASLLVLLYITTSHAQPTSGLTIRWLFMWIFTAINTPALISHTCSDRYWFIHMSWLRVDYLARTYKGARSLFGFELVTKIASRALNNWAMVPHYRTNYWTSSLAILTIMQVCGWFGQTAATLISGSSWHKLDWKL